MHDKGNLIIVTSREHGCVKADASRLGTGLYELPAPVANSCPTVSGVMLIVYLHTCLIYSGSSEKGWVKRPRELLRTVVGDSTRRHVGFLSLCLGDPIYHKQTIYNISSSLSDKKSNDHIPPHLEHSTLPYGTKY